MVTVLRSCSHVVTLRKPGSLPSTNSNNTDLIYIGAVLVFLQILGNVWLPAPQKLRMGVLQHPTRICLGCYKPHFFAEWGVIRRRFPRGSVLDEVRVVSDPAHASYLWGNTGFCAGGTGCAL